MLTYCGNYIRDDSLTVHQYGMRHFDTVVLEDQGFMVPINLANCVAYVGPLITLSFISDTTAELHRRRPSWHYWLYETIFDPEVAQKNHAATVLYVEPDWVKAVNWSIFVQFILWLWVSFRW